MSRWWWQRALVTGASAGIGETMARQLADAGVATVLVARRADRLSELASTIRSRGGEVEVLPADLLDAEERAAVEHRLAADGSEHGTGPIDLLVNSAGFGSFGRFAELDRDVEQREIELNVTALTRLTHAVLPAMLARGRGSVLNVSSLAAFQPYPYAATYGASKAFVNSLSHALYEETRGTGVSVTALCPGFTHTEFQQVAGVEEAAVPGSLWSLVDDVARDGLGAAAAGKSVAVPGRTFRVAAAVSSVVPARLSRRVVGTQTARRLRAR